MPGAGVISLALRMGKLPQQLLDELEDEPEWWQQRFWIYVNNGGQ